MTMECYITECPAHSLDEPFCHEEECIGLRKMRERIQELEQELERYKGACSYLGNRCSVLARLIVAERDRLAVMADALATEVDAWRTDAILREDRARAEKAEAERDRLKTALRKKCACELSADGETVEKWCRLHGDIRDERDRLQGWTGGGLKMRLTRY